MLKREYIFTATYIYLQGYISRICHPKQKKKCFTMLLNVHASSQLKMCFQYEVKTNTSPAF